MSQITRVAAHAIVILLLTAVSAARSQDPANRRTPAKQRIEKALGEKVDFDFVGVPLHDVVRAIGELHHINIRLDRQAIREGNLDEDAPVTFHVGGITLRSALRHLLDNLQLEYVVMHEILLITDDRGAERFDVVRVHQVGDLLRPSHVRPWSRVRQWSQATYRLSSGEEPPDFDALSQIFMTIVEPDTWPEGTGPGPIRSLGSDLIVFPQMARVHDEIARLLEAMRTIPLLDDQKPAQVYSPIDIDLHRAARLRIEKALDAPATLSFAGIPLKQVIDTLRDKLGIPILVDEVVFNEAPLPLDQPVTFHCDGISYRSALRLMLADLKLAAVIEDEILLITLSEYTDNFLSTVIYPVGDIVDRYYEDDGTFEVDFEALIGAIQSIDLAAWDEIGGTGSLAPFAQRGLLIIAATDAIHAKIRRLLGEIRAARKASGYQPTSGTPDPTEIVERAYRPYPSHYQDADNRHDAKDTAALLEAVRPVITRLLGNTIDDEHDVVYLPDRIVVRHRRDIQVKLQRRLGQLGFEWSGY